MALRPYLLSAGAFAVGSSTYVVAGLLPAVVTGLGVSLTAAGQLTTVFAISYALAAPLLATVTGRWERRTLLVTALLVVAVGSALSALTTGYPLVLAGRAVAGLGAAAYTPAATLVATQLLGAAHRGRAVALVFGGLTFALLLGVPAGSLLGGPLGFRGVFALVALVAVLAALAVRGFLPRVDAPPVVGLRERLAVAADGRVLAVLSITVIGVVATMSIYTYVVPLLTASAGVGPAVIGVLLLAYGVGAMVGNSVGGHATDRAGSMRTLIVVLIGFVAVVATMPLTMTTALGAGLVMFVWSVFTWAFNSPLQSLLLQIAPAGGLVLALNASAIFVGVGLSGVVGGLIIDTVGVRGLPPVSAVLGVIALAVLLIVRRAGTRTAGRPAPVASLP